MPHTRRALIRLLTVAAFAATVALPASATTRASVDRTAFARNGTVGSSGEAMRIPGEAGVPRVGTTLPGIDISHWQGEIDWAKVAGAGKRFAFMKATDGVNYVDPTFATNRAQARANGLSVGAYHFARPDPSRGDARREARHFVDVAGPKPGDLLPVLDMETSKGLGQGGVTRWARTWVRTVRSLTGVTPLVYTSPYGWATRTGDTRLLARDGAPLWVAHWGVSSPTLPAAGWDGRGWLVWQHTSSGHVRGIGGRVDLDKLAGTRLGVITIRRLSLEITGDSGRVTSSPAGLGCAGTCAHSVHPDVTVTLTAVPDEHAYFTGWSGACEGAGLTCTVSMRDEREVRARFVTDVSAPTATITPPAGLSGPAVVGFDERVRGVGTQSLVLREAAGGRVAARRLCRDGSGAPVACDTAAVRSVSIRPTSPFVPGREYEVELNPEGATPAVRDAVGNAATTTSSAFEASRSVEQSSGAVVRSPARAWTTDRATRASGGSYTLARRTDAAARMAFEGTGVRWITVTGPDRGRARIFVDGELIRTVDLYAPTRTFGVLRQIEGLVDRAHVLRIVATGHGRPAATGTAVPIDRLDVQG